jgi:hypothetical protein
MKWGISDFCGTNFMRLGIACILYCSKLKVLLALKLAVAIIPSLFA